MLCDTVCKWWDNCGVIREAETLCKHVVYVLGKVWYTSQRDHFRNFNNTRWHIFRENLPCKKKNARRVRTRSDLLTEEFAKNVLHYAELFTTKNVLSTKNVKLHFCEPNKIVNTCSQVEGDAKKRGFTFLRCGEIAFAQ